MKNSKKQLKGKNQEAGSIKKIVIVGLPNSGKSNVFNAITGEYTIVANYPLTTIEVLKKQCIINGQPYEVFDTPGLHSLYIHSDEEKNVRDLLFSEQPDLLIQCIDANQIKQSLVLTSDLMELGIPMVISLNAMDETLSKGIRINTDRLSQMLDFPVIEIIGLQDRAKEKLHEAIEQVHLSMNSFRYSDKIEKMIMEIEAALPEDNIYRRKTAILLLQRDQSLLNDLRKQHKDQTVSQIKEKADTTRSSISVDVGRIINKSRHSWVDDIFEKVVKKQKGEDNAFLNAFAYLSRHPIFGIPILVMFLLITYLLVVYVAGFIDTILSFVLLDPVTNFISSIIPSGFWHEFMVGHYGVFTLGFFNAIVTVLPILSVFFLMFAFLEDIGYMPNLCVLTKRIFEKIGLTGNAIMPLILGFGCKTMATLVTKGLASKKEKFIAIYLIAFAIPCSAQLGINMGILGKVGLLAFVIAFSVMIFVELVAGFILNKIIKNDGNNNYFIQELSPIRLPSIKAIFVKTYYRLFWFLKEALPVFIVAAIIIFFADKLGALNAIKNVLNPVVVKWLGLPVDIVDVLILCVARREAAAGLLINMVDEGLFNYIQCIVAVVITTISFPCFANITVIGKELGLKATIVIISAIMVSSLLFGGILNWILFFTIGG
jgi:ferrous iron transport protein B